MILIVWDTRGDGHDSDNVFWCGPPSGDDERDFACDVRGWTSNIAEAIDYATRPAPRDEADADLTVARETVQRGAQRGRVEVQEVL